MSNSLLEEEETTFQSSEIRRVHMSYTLCEEFALENHGE